jgi:hypothetical protein
LSIAISPLCVDVGSVRGTATLAVVGEDGNDHGDDPLADGSRESRPEIAETLRSSVVGPAERSERAKRKDLTKRTEDDSPVHSYRTLLEDLKTLCKNRIRTTGQQPCEFYLLTQPTDVQRRALELLGVSLSS